MDASSSEQETCQVALESVWVVGLRAEMFSGLALDVLVIFADGFLQSYSSQP